MSNILFHNKYHLTNHHTVSTYGYPDSATDPIGSLGQEFLGTFYNVFTTTNKISTNSIEWWSGYTTLSSLSTIQGYNLYLTARNSVTALSSNWSDGYSFYSSYTPSSSEYRTIHTFTLANSSHWPWLDNTLRLNLPQESTHSKTFAGVQSNVSSVTAAFYLDLLSPNFNNVGLAPGAVSTFTRASSATFYSSNGSLSFVGFDVPRQEFKYSNITSKWEVQGLLIEPRKTNNVIYSQDFDDALWVASGCTITPDSILSPLQTLSADIIEVIGNPAGFYQSVTVLPNTYYTFSVFVKLGTMLQSNYTFYIYDQTNGLPIVNYEPSDVPLSTSSWSRVSYTFKTPAGCTQISLYPIRTITASVTDTIYLWGAQLEEGETLTSFIPTESIIYTREQEFATIQGDFFSNDQGTFFTETLYTGTTASSGAFTILRLFNPLRTNTINIRLNKNKFSQSFGEINNSSNLAFNLISPLSYNVSIPKKTALSYIRNNIVLADSGHIVATDTSSLIPTTLSSCYIGLSADAPAGDSFCGYIRRVGYYRQKVNNNILRYLTLSAHDFESIDQINSVSWNLSTEQVCVVPLTGDMFCENRPLALKKKGGNYTLILKQDRGGRRQVVFDTDFILKSPLSGTNFVSLSSYSVTVIPFVSDGDKLYGKPTYYYYGLDGVITYFNGDGITITPSPVGLFAGETLVPVLGLTIAGIGGAPYTQSDGITILEV